MPQGTVADELESILGPLARKIEPQLAAWLDDASIPAELAKAMRYAVLDGGKRLRPALVVLSAKAVATPDQWRGDPMAAAAAIEMVHGYSLVHDDLPAMDDDDLRRGRPTCHVKFGEAMAILAGDALLTRAFEAIVLGAADKALAAEVVAELAAAAGPAGMVAGQVADMGLCHVPEGEAGRSYIHRRKTGALIRAAVRMGALCAGADETALAAVTEYGERIGLAFQIHDDLLDATASAEVIGKTPGKDAHAGKRTYATEMEIDQARRLADELTERACAALSPLGRRNRQLCRLARLLTRRQK